MTSIGLPAGFFQGTLDEVRIWNVARSAAGNPGRDGRAACDAAANLIGRWALNEGTGTTTADSSGRGTTARSPTDRPGSPARRSCPRRCPRATTRVKMLGTVPPATTRRSVRRRDLGAATFTVETWFRRDGAGVSTSTGTGGIDAIPLVTKGRAEGERQQRRHELLPRHPRHGRRARRRLRGRRGGRHARVEPSARGRHADCDRAGNPTDADWHHAAVTYDGTTLRLYLDGVPAVLGRRRTAAARRQHPARGAGHGLHVHRRRGRVLRRRARRGADLELRPQRRADRRRHEPRDPGRARAARPLGLQRQLRHRAWIRREQPERHDVAGRAGRGCAGAPFTGGANAAPVVDAGADQAVTLPARRR